MTPPPKQPPQAARPPSAPYQLVPRTCTECHRPYLPTGSGAICPDCQPPTEHAPRTHRRIHERDKRSAHQRGYDYRWRQLSKRARRLQDWCSDCGSQENLTADHSIEAWQRYEQGKPIRLEHIDVVCIDCNLERGHARGDQATDQYRDTDRHERIARERIDIEASADNYDQLVALGIIEPE